MVLHGPAWSCIVIITLLAGMSEENSDEEAGIDPDRPDRPDNPDNIADTFAGMQLQDPKVNAYCMHITLQPI